jgi:hypothetical protein
MHAVMMTLPCWYQGDTAVVLLPLQVLELGEGLVEVAATETEQPLKCGTFSASGTWGPQMRNHSSGA